MMTSVFYLFIVVALLMVVLALAWIGPRLFSAPGVKAGSDRKLTNLAVYRDELSQLSLDFECGRISEDALDEARAELGKRLLADTDGIEESNAGQRMKMPKRAVGILVMGLMPALATGLYLHVGSLQALNTMAGGESESDFYQNLRTHLEEQPRDGRAWVALGRVEMEANRFKEAAAAYEQARQVSEKIANDATIICEQAEAIGMMQGGVFKGRPRELVEKAMELSPNNPLVLEMAGGAAYEAGDYAAAAGYWKQLRSQIEEDTQAYTEISIAIARAEAEHMGAGETLPGEQALAH